jgi:glycyl-tRNA synthetase beta chain
MADFLLEIGLEEVPARMLAAAQEELGERVLALLTCERLVSESAAVKTCSTPRRVAVLMEGLAAKQPDAEEQLTGPAWSVAFKDGAPTPAAHAFARKAGVAVEQLFPLTTPKGEYTSATVARPGRSAVDLLRELLPKEIAALAWPKPMYWRAGKPERFVRPVQWLVALLDEEIVPLEFAGVRARNLSRGHRVLHGPAPVAIANPARYAETLRGAFVEPDVEARRHTIRKALDRVTRTLPNARWREDESLVDTVTHLTEWPSVVVGRFDSGFLTLPEEVLVTVMRDHQKYFAVEDETGTLLPHFLTVLNTAAEPAGEATIRHGNERVLRARFSDARFFWTFDQKIPLAERVELLKSVTFQKDLGNYHEKSVQTRQIAAQLAALVDARGLAVNVQALDQAALLAKTDLTTELVKEFTELQGIVGGLYARAQGHDRNDTAAVADAIYWQYSPASLSDPIPPTVEGQLLGLADRIGTIASMFSIGLAPSGSRDPFALRRAANAVIKILALSRLPLTLAELMAAAVSDESAVNLSSFLKERLSFYLREVDGIAPDVVTAVLAAGADNIPDAQRRCEALTAVRGSDDFTAIAAAWKRSKNILRQSKEKSIAAAASVDPALLHEEQESRLWQAVRSLAPEIEAYRQRGDYTQALERIATLRPDVDRFFDTVMVMAEDPAVRANRLALLTTFSRELGKIADFSELTPEQTQ